MNGTGGMLNSRGLDCPYTKKRGKGQMRPVVTEDITTKDVAHTTPRENNFLKSYNNEKCSQLKLLGA